MLGLFIIPFFSVSLFLGLIGLGLFIYLLLRKIFVSYLSTSYSIATNTAILRLQDLSFTPSVLNFFGVILFFLGLWFTLFNLSVMKQYHTHKPKIFNIFFYLLVYLTIYPLIMITGLAKLVTRRYSW